MRMSLPTAVGSMCWYRSGSTLMALACRPALCANALAPTYGWRAYGEMFVISLIACEMRVASSRPSPVSVRTPCLSSRFATTVSRSTLPVRSPYPFTVPWTCAAPASTAASVFATAQPESLCACIPSNASPAARRVRAGARRRRAAPPRSRRPTWEHAAVGVAQRDDLGAGLERGLHGRARERGVVPVAVEEVLRVDDDAASSLTRKDTVSVIMARPSSGVVRSARSTCRTSDFATSVTTGASESTSARTCGSSHARSPALRVAPNAASTARRRSSSLAARRKNSVSLGTAPGQPPSMKPTPSSSSSGAMASLSATERFMPSCCAPSRRVVS